MPPRPRGQGPPGRHLDPGIARGTDGSRDGRVDLGGSLARDPAQRGVQGAFRLPVCHLRPAQRQGHRFTATVRAPPERARGGEGARSRGGEEDMSPPAAGSRARRRSEQVIEP